MLARVLAVGVLEGNLFALVCLGFNARAISGLSGLGVTLLIVLSSSSTARPSGLGLGDRDRHRGRALVVRVTHGGRFTRCRASAAFDRCLRASDVGDRAWLHGRCFLAPMDRLGRLGGKGRYVRL